MGKNNQLINQYRDMHRQIENITPAIYASIALAINRKYGWKHNPINRIFKESQEIWEEHRNDLEGMCKRCEDEVGIIIKRG